MLGSPPDKIVLSGTVRLGEIGRRELLGSSAGCSCKKSPTRIRCHRLETEARRRIRPGVPESYWRRVSGQDWLSTAARKTGVLAAGIEWCRARHEFRDYADSLRRSPSMMATVPRMCWRMASRARFSSRSRMAAAIASWSHWRWGIASESGLLIPAVLMRKSDRSHIRWLASSMMRELAIAWIAAWNLVLQVIFDVTYRWI